MKIFVALVIVCVALVAARSETQQPSSDGGGMFGSRGNNPGGLFHNTFNGRQPNGGSDSESGSSNFFENIFKRSQGDFRGLLEKISDTLERIEQRLPSSYTQADDQITVADQAVNDAVNKANNNVPQITAN